MIFPLSFRNLLDFLRFWIHGASGKPAMLSLSRCSGILRLHYFPGIPGNLELKFELSGIDPEILGDSHAAILQLIVPIVSGRLKILDRLWLVQIVPDPIGTMKRIQAVTIYIR
jgi:hypothetical protein